MLFLESKTKFLIDDDGYRVTKYHRCKIYEKFPLTATVVDSHYVGPYWYLPPSLWRLTWL